MRVTAVIPTYNEAENLPRLVSALLALPLDLRLLVVDDHSRDGTGPIADTLAAQDERIRVLHRETKQGLRLAYLNGFRSALKGGAEAVLQIDADLSHDPAKAPELVKRLETCDVVLGSRYIEGGSVDSAWPLWRKYLSSFGNVYARTILGLPLKDVTTGFRLWRREVLQGIPLDRIRSSGYVFQVETVYLAYCLGYRIAEFPIYFSDRKIGKSKMSWQIQLEAAFRVWQVWWSYRDLRKGEKQERPV